MITTRAKNRLYDKFHKAWVWTCLGITGACVVHLSYEFVMYMMYVRPHKKEMEEQLKQELLREGLVADKVPIADS